ncbi:MAG TPA: hypothetical protein VFL14_01115 [Xanthomonadales bacterium]|nr:hypothetical protein [Xanthomonadales bacterium]
MRFTVRLLLAVLLLLPLVATAQKPEKVYRLTYTIEPLPDQDAARVTIRLGEGAQYVSRINFRIHPERQTGIKADGELSVEGERAIWHPPATGGTFTLLAKVSHPRKGGKFDALMTHDWAIFRGDDMVPAALVRQKKGAHSRARLYFRLPPGWDSVDTGWLRAPDGSFYVDNPGRSFDRPIGWMIAGKVATRRDTIGHTDVAVGGPIGADVRRMDVLALLNLIWPEVEQAFGRTPRKLLIASAPDPLWRGGLSAPNSLFLHADRPLVSENGTSSLMHELTHVITRIRGARNDDWIAEGVAEFYAIEIFRRAGALSDSRYSRTRQDLREWSRPVKTLRVRHSKGEVTARAVLLFQDLDREIRTRTKDAKSLDDVVRELMGKHGRKVSLEDLRAAAEKVLGAKSRTLESPLLAKPAA